MPIIPVAIGIAIGWLASKWMGKHPAARGGIVALPPTVWVVWYIDAKTSKKKYRGKNGKPMFWRSQAKAQREATKLTTAHLATDAGVEQYTGPAPQLPAKGAA